MLVLFANVTWTCFINLSVYVNVSMNDCLSGASHPLSLGIGSSAPVNLMADVWMQN